MKTNLVVRVSTTEGPFLHLKISGHNSVTYICRSPRLEQCVARCQGWREGTLDKPLLTLNIDIFSSLTVRWTPQEFVLAYTIKPRARSYLQNSISSLSQQRMGGLSQPWIGSSGARVVGSMTKPIFRSYKFLIVFGMTRGGPRNFTQLSNQALTHDEVASSQ